VGRQSFTWKTDTLSGNVARLPQKVQRAIVGATEYGATKAQGYAKTHAKWTDQTANARQGLRAFAIHETGKSTIVITHGVPYGIWLEVRFSGRYAIIGPTQVYAGELTMRLLGNLFSGDIKATS
jgi:selenocysteine lyase/cysteine desulfurase